ncbi:complement component receptor 1-like protein isoform X3 [Dermochelys coriacea]|uniref:complement component receptor 1-like protein isoform X3 n=1 Tax=Dermochelys coriacea TaxID=27794 RepID=UPI0018E763D6|nr:complement component receptor 1-like protein isoform X3 [Dermochelys coriacea]
MVTLSGKLFSGSSNWSKRCSLSAFDRGLNALLVFLKARLSCREARGEEFSSDGRTEAPSLAVTRALGEAPSHPQPMIRLGVRGDQLALESKRDGPVPLGSNTNWRRKTPASSPAEKTSSGHCGVPPRLSFAELQDEFKVKEIFPVGTSVKYSCRSGYQRVPGQSSTLTCVNESVWSEPKVFCQGKSCGHPGDLANGKVHIKDLVFGSNITFSCDEGFRLVGHNTSLCVIHETRVAWNHDIPFCEEIPCHPPPDIKNGEHSGDPNTHYTYGSTVTYICNTVPRGTDPFSLIGEASIHCTSDEDQNGIWSGEPPQCKVVQCKNAEVENGRKLSGFGPSYSYQDAITFGCEAGYFMVGSHVIICQANNLWSPPIPTCEKIPQSVCGAPPFPNGKMLPSKPQYVTGDGITLTCEANYVLPDGAKSMTSHCKGNNVWDPSVQTCQLPRSVCGAPWFPNGKMLPSKPQYVTGDGITLTCEVNYVLPNDAKSMTSHCKRNNMWDPPVQICQRVCPDLVISHGRVKSGGKPHYVVGDHVTIECYAAYTMPGEPKIHCTDKFKWEPVIPECRLRVYIIIIICVIVIAAGMLTVTLVYKKFFSQKGKHVSTSPTAEYTSCKT